jgi:hypothetical protein
MAILGLVLFSSLCLLSGAASILRLAFPVASFAVGVFLYCRYPILYLGFTWWLWFLMPFVTRLVDYRSGWWDPQRLMLVSPFLVTLLTCTTFCQYLPRSYHQGGLPFILAFIGVVYGFLVALIKGSPFVAARALLDWLAPIVFGFHLFVNWQNYPSYRQNLQRHFLWGVLVLGAYGVLQYLIAPEWDRLWLVASEMTTSAGDPEPFRIRVWSTLNSPGHFACVMMAGLLLLFTSQEALRWPTIVVGYLAFLLSIVRSAWGGWFVGLLTLISSLNPRRQMGIIITIVVIALWAFSLATIEPFSNYINPTFQSLSNLGSDDSYNVRKSIYQDNLGLAFSEGLGQGLGYSEFPDSGILEIFSTLGWLGAIPFLAGAILLLFNVFHKSKGRFDPFVTVAWPIALSCFVMLPNGNSIIALPGVIFWGFSGMVMAAHKYYLHQGSTELPRN